MYDPKLHVRNEEGAEEFFDFALAKYIVGGEPPGGFVDETAQSD